MVNSLHIECCKLVYCSTVWNSDSITRHLCVSFVELLFKKFYRLNGIFLSFCTCLFFSASLSVPLHFAWNIIKSMSLVAMRQWIRQSVQSRILWQRTHTLKLCFNPKSSSAQTFHGNCEFCHRNSIWIEYYTLFYYNMLSYRYPW